MDLESIFRLEYYVKNGFPTTQINNTIKYFINLLDELTDEDESILDDYVIVINNSESLIRETSTAELFSEFKKKVFKKYITIILSLIEDDYTFNYALKHYKNYPFFKTLKFNATYKMCKSIVKNISKLKRKDIGILENYLKDLRANKKAHGEILEYINYLKGKYILNSNNPYIRDLKEAKRYLLLCNIFLKKEAQNLIIKIEKEEKQIELEIKQEKERIRIQKENQLRKEEELRQKQLEYERKKQRELERIKKEEEDRRHYNKTQLFNSSYFRNCNSLSIPEEYLEIKQKLGNNMEFCHVTALSNAISIIKNKYIYSRNLASSLNTLKYDNTIKNETTAGVMYTNHSTKIEDFVRFYMNPLNDATYAFKKNFEKNNTFGVIFSINFSLFYKYHYGIILTHQNAHHLSNDDLNLNIYDITNKHNIKNINFDKFNFEHTFSKYDPTDDINIKDYQKAEVLIYEKLPLSCITHIYFANQMEYNIFISKLSQDEINFIRDICVICPLIFWR